MKMDQPSFNRFLTNIDDYAANREWEDFSDDSFVEDIVHMIGKALGYENNPNGYERSVNHVVQVLRRRAPQCFKTDIRREDVDIPSVKPKQAAGGYLGPYKGHKGNRS